MEMIEKMKMGLITGISLFMLSCNSWLDIEPEDRIMEDALFKDQVGFLTALNGVYTEMNSTAVYGQNLSMGMIDVMAQYYNCAIESHPFRFYMNYAYSGKDYKARFDNIWTKLYALIANCNAILEHCDDGKNILSPDYYKLVKGEALGLRAMMHLDVLRMFGPIYSDASEAKAYIPYMTKSDRGVQPLMSSDSVVAHIIRDLKLASDLLIQVDPVVIYKEKYYTTFETENNFNYRQYRLNYYAVQALLARTYLWAGDRTKAGEYARGVIENANLEEKPVFPLVTADYMRDYKDRFFSTEVLFGLYNTSRSERVYKAFFIDNLAANYLITMPGDLASGRVSFFYDDQNDYRYKMWEQTVQNSKSIVYFTKYKDETNIQQEAYYETFRYMIPLIRLSEMYLIAAECENDIQVAVDKYFNPLRFHRNCVNLNATSIEELERLIQAEYMKEFIGEGQLFFYFKRKALQNIPDGTKPNNTQNMDLANYVFPLPDSETSQRAE